MTAPRDCPACFGSQPDDEPDHRPWLCVAGVVTGLWLALLLVAGFVLLAWISA